MKRKTSLGALLLALFVTYSSLAAIRLPSALSSNMVLQQQSTTMLWGWADPAEKILVTLSWNNTVDSVITSGDARWKINIKTPLAGGPYTITLRGWNTVILENIMIGEVWVCSGQSNMEWSSNQNLKQIIDELPNSSNNNIRLFHVSKTSAESEQDNLPGEWKVCSPETLKGFSAIGYFFAKKLQNTLNVPVGIINSSWSGTPAEVWTPASIINEDEPLKQAATKLTPAAWWPVAPGLTYNTMIAPLKHFTIAGAIWYQGEGNTGTAATYQKLFTKMIGAWRKAWQKDFPFYYVQIAPFIYGNKHVGALLREQQAKALSYPNTGMVVITDLVDNIKDIHPQNKKDVADRLANLALADTYKQAVAAFQSPLFNHMEVNKGKVNLFFDHAANGFMIKGTGKATGFYVAGADKMFIPAEARLEKDRIVVFNKQVSAPVAVRFSFSNTGISNVFSKEGLPVSPFRTDDWEVDTSKEKQ